MNALFLGTYEDKEYLPHLKSVFGGTTTFIICEPIALLTQLEMYCTKNNITAVVSTSTTILRKLLEKSGWSGRSSPSLSDYAGSVFTHKNLEIVFVPPVATIVTVPHGKFVWSRFASKVLHPENWPEATPFAWTWKILEPSTILEVYADLASSYAIAEDIETLRENLAIRCVSFTAVHLVKGKFHTNSYCLPLLDDWAIAWYRKISELPNQKIFQNGQYDNAYKLRYGIPTKNWLWDTCNLFHSWYSELPKDLAFLNAFFLRKVVYWKDLAETQDHYEYYKYNCLDSWATANVWIRQMLEMPDWARHNYSLEFPLVFPCLLSEMTGIEQDEQKLLQARKQLDTQIETEVSILRKMLHCPAFNSNSPKQVLAVLHILGANKIKSTEEKDLKKAALLHPLLSVIANKILTIRGLRKLVSTYLRLDEDATTANNFNGRAAYRGRIFYSLKPSGTDTARLASKKSAFWCGLQIQNIPRGEPGDISYTKTTLCASDGFVLAGVDLKSAETYDTAYISGSKPLMEILDSDKKFHAWNASKFFGIPYTDIYCKETGKTLNKEIYDISKRVNHGFNYNIGADTLIDTMGEDKVWKARALLKLSASMGSKGVAQYLLNQANNTYPEIRRDYYPWVIQEVTVKRKLTSYAVHYPHHYPEPLELQAQIERGDWTRFTFLHPDKNKLHLNSLVAHCPQSLNARTLNEAYMKVFYEIALPEAKNFRLHAQIHDEILCSFRKGRLDLLKAVQTRMQIPVAVRDVKGITRIFTVPASLKAGPKNEGVKYWSEVE